MQHVAVKRFDAFQRLRQITTVAIGAVLVVASSVALSFAQKSSQTTFPSAEAASHALFVAVQSDNEQAVTQVLGGETELVSTDDSAEDKLEREHFAKQFWIDRCAEGDQKCTVTCGRDPPHLLDSTWGREKFSE